MNVQDVMSKAASSYSKWGVVAVNVPTTMERALKRLHREISPKDLHARGIESEPHATIAYGLGKNVKLNRLKLAFALATPVTFRVENVSTFENGDYVVLKYKVKSGELSYLRRKIKNEFATPGSSFRFNPHVTIAYLKRGADVQKYKKKFEELVGRSYTTTRGFYNPKGFGKKWEIRIGRGQHAMFQKVAEDELGDYMYIPTEDDLVKSAAPGDEVLDRSRSAALSLNLMPDPPERMLHTMIQRHAGPEGASDAMYFRNLLDNLKDRLAAAEPGSEAAGNLTKLYDDLYSGLVKNRDAFRGAVVGTDFEPKGGLRTFYDDWLDRYAPQRPAVVAEVPVKPVAEVAEKVPTKMNGSWLKEMLSNKKVLGGLGALGLAGAGGAYLLNREKAAEHDVDAAPEGKCWRVLWADGRAQACFRNKSDAQEFWDSGVGHSWFEGVQNGPKLVDRKKGWRVSRVSKKFKCSGKDWDEAQCPRCKREGRKFKKKSDKVKKANAQQIDVAKHWMHGFRAKCLEKGYDPLVVMDLNNERTEVN